MANSSSIPDRNGPEAGDLVSVYAVQEIWSSDSNTYITKQIKGIGRLASVDIKSEKAVVHLMTGERVTLNAKHISFVRPATRKEKP